MKIMSPTCRIVRATHDGLDAIEEAARLCYLSEPKESPVNTEKYDKYLKATSGPAPNLALNPKQSFSDFSRNTFLESLLKRGHMTPFEFMDIEIEFEVNRGVTHEAVRHRMCSPMQESTRYCNYSKGKFGGDIAVIKPIFFPENDPPKFVPDFVPVRSDTVGEQPRSVAMSRYSVWHDSMRHAEWAYLTLLKLGASPQEARDVLPNATKAKIKIKANVREWFHIFELRAVSLAAHPQMREAMIMALELCAEQWPVLFLPQLEKCRNNDAHNPKPPVKAPKKQPTSRFIELEVPSKVSEGSLHAPASNYDELVLSLAQDLDLTHLKNTTMEYNVMSDKQMLVLEFSKWEGK